MVVNPYVGLLIDGVLAILLIAGILACVKVYKNLETIRQGQSEMAGLVQSLNNAVLDAQRCIAELKYMATDVEEKLDSEIDKGQKLRDELVLITEAGNNLADRIEQGLTGQSTAGAQSGETSKSGTKVQQISPGRQKEILSALKQAR